MKIKNTVTTVIMAALLFGLSLACWLKAPDDFSESERRTLSKLPELSAGNILSGGFMSKFETYTQDQFPARDIFRSLKSFAALDIFRQKDNNGLYMADGHLSKVDYPVNTRMLDNAANKFKRLYDNYLSNAKVYFTVVPDKNFFLAPNNGYICADFDMISGYMRDKLDYMEYIEISDLLSLDDYYSTDSHWRQNRIFDVAERLAAAMGTELKGKYTENQVEAPFCGVYAGQIALPVEPDHISYLTNSVTDNAVVTSYNTGKPVSVPFYNLSKTEGRDPYEMFLNGADALLTIENPEAETDRELIIFRDSFGSSLVPLLVEGYSKVILVDIRYIQSALLDRFIDFGNQDVLFMYSTTLLNNSLALK